MSEPMIGEIRLFPYGFAPVGWVLCDGSKLAIRDYAPLAAIIGNTYGGDLQTYFNIPDLRARAAASFGNDPDDVFDPTIGASGGVESVALSPAQLPPHSHTLNGATIALRSEVAAPTGNWLGVELLVKQPSGTEVSKTYAVAGTAPDTTLNSGTLSPYQGLGQAHENRQPYLVLGYYIATQGEFFPNPN